MANPWPSWASCGKKWPSCLSKSTPREHLPGKVTMDLNFSVFAEPNEHAAMIPNRRHIVGRLAPSPTGAQHIGNARTYVIAWLSARAQKGRVLLRMEDIDSPRIKAGAADQAIDDLRWLGLDWDEEPIVQTGRISLYEDALRQLQKRELVYPCTCSRSDMEQAA